MHGIGRDHSRGMTEKKHELRSSIRRGEEVADRLRVGKQPASFWSSTCADAQKRLQCNYLP